MAFYHFYLLGWLIVEMLRFKSSGFRGPGSRAENSRSMGPGFEFRLWTNS